ncbi:MAG: hypothetical protein RIB67_04200 [Miltoncostaeaceae bacterium]
MRLAVKGDWGHGTAAQAAVTRRICAEHRRAPLAAVVTTGDNFSRPEGVATPANFTRPEACLRRAGVPYIAAWGNNDLAGDATAIALGAPGRYYATPVGPLRLVVLDANSPADPAQLAFLDAELAAARSAGEVPVPVMHQPLASAGYHSPDPDQRALWVPRLRAAGVRVVLQGHNHAYERIVADGITHLTTGGGGAPVFPCLRRPEGLRSCRPRHHALIVTAWADWLFSEALTPEGEVLDRALLALP